MRFVDKDLLSVQEARILMENAGEARKVLAGFEQERLDRIVVHMAQAAAKHARELAVMSCEETEYGNWQDKYRKNRYISANTCPRSLRPCVLWESFRRTGKRK